MAELRLGLVGAGDGAQTLADALGACEHVRATAVCDPNTSSAERLAAVLGIPALETPDELLARADVDAVVVAVPTFLTGMLAQAGARAGKHVLMLPPGATGPEEALHALKAAQAAGMHLCTLLAERYAAPWRVLREVVASGALGDVRSLHLGVTVARDAGWWLAGSGPEGWRGRRLQAGGGVLLGEALPLLDAAAWATGLVAERVSAEHGAAVPDVEVEDLGGMLIAYRGGALGTIHVAWAAPGGAGPMGEGGQRVLGTRGQAVVLRDGLWLFSADGWGDRVPPGQWTQVPTPQRAPAQALFLDAFAQALQAGQDPPVADEAGLEALKVIGAGYQSRRLGRAIRLDEVLQKVVMATWTTIG